MIQNKSSLKYLSWLVSRETLHSHELERQVMFPELETSTVNNAFQFTKEDCTTNRSPPLPPLPLKTLDEDVWLISSSSSSWFSGFSCSWLFFWWEADVPLRWRCCPGHYRPRIQHQRQHHCLRHRPRTRRTLPPPNYTHNNTHTEQHRLVCLAEF